TTFYLSRLELDSGYYYLMALYTIRMFGMSMVMMPIMTNGLNQLPMKSNPHGTAMNNTSQQVTGAIGSAILLTIMTMRMEKSGESIFKDAAASGNIPADKGGMAALEHEIGLKAMIDGIIYSFLVATFIALAALILTLFVKRVRPPKYEEMKSPQTDTSMEGKPVGE